MQRRQGPTVVMCAAGLLGVASLDTPAAGAPVASAASFRSCPDVKVNLEDGVRQTYELKAKRTSCAVAHRVARRSLTSVGDSPDLYGYTCRLAYDIELTCRKGKGRVKWLTQNRFD